jgi:L-lactate dehydrogenase complex protein LldE
MIENKRVALFVTCLVDQVMPEVGVATVRLLRRAGYQVDFPKQQTCCGQPFFNSGFRQEAARLARRTVEIFEEHEAVVLPSGSCASMIRTEYPHLLQDSPRWHYPAKRLAAKSYELSEFLVHQAGWTEKSERLAQAQPVIPEENRRVTYHDSCHMCRLLGIRREPRQLLQAAGSQVTEMAESDRCCGFGGVFSIRMPEVSTGMTAEKVGQARDTGAATLVTADPGCLMQMRGLLQAKPGANDQLQVKHLATVLEEATR